MFIQCFIEKADGSDVFVDFEGVRYIFPRNTLGDAVCFVGNQAHARRLLAMGPGSYEEYIPPDDVDISFQPGATAVPLGGTNRLRRDPEADEPLADGLTVDEALTEGGQVESAPPETETDKNSDGTPNLAPESSNAEGSAGGAPIGDPVIPADQVTPIDDLSETEKAQAEADKQAALAPVEVQWAPEAVATKIKEFKFLDKDSFKVFVHNNADRIIGWPKEVRGEVAKKLNKNFPGLDPGIEGFVINDYLGSGNTVNP